MSSYFGDDQPSTEMAFIMIGYEATQIKDWTEGARGGLTNIIFTYREISSTAVLRDRVGGFAASLSFRVSGNIQCD